MTKDPTWGLLKELKVMKKSNSLLKVFILLLVSHLFILTNAMCQLRGTARVMFYNVENLFDTFDDPSTNDEEFLPTGERHWTEYRLSDKLEKIAKVIMAVGGWEAPEVIGLCEVENREILEKLLSYTSLKTIPYKIIHKQSPDRRGIDVALLFRSDAIEPIKYEYLEVSDSNNVDFKTRDILFFSGVVRGIDTLHFFVNHWPSRYGGLMETVEKRALAARVLKSKIDQLQKENSRAKIIIMGDLNDEPEDQSLLEVLNSKNNTDSVIDNALYNLSAQFMKSNQGTHKYQSQWSVFDHIIVSGELLSSPKGIYSKVKDAHVYEAPFLLMKDKTYGGYKPHRTYIGYKYNGGFSDHLPVFLDLWEH